MRFNFIIAGKLRLQGCGFSNLPYPIHVEKTESFMFIQCIVKGLVNKRRIARKPISPSIAYIQVMPEPISMPSLLEGTELPLCFRVRGTAKTRMLTG